MIAARWCQRETAASGQPLGSELIEA
jgi:hypothetical protein